jgi:hypothetical protein
MSDVGAGSPAATRELAEHFHSRFVARTEPPSPGTGNAFIDVVIDQYRQYWTTALLGEMPIDNGSETLHSALGATLQHHGWPVDDRPATTDTFELVQAALHAEGVYALTGPAPPLQELLVWARQSQTDYDVVLSDQRRQVTVIVMSDFYSRGWKEYASLGLAATTAWVQDGSLYCADSAFEPGTETFEVSYLKHETRHLVDLEQFPGLSSAELEYRAKLTELIFARETQRRLLDDFTAKRAPNPDSPHAAANFRVTSDLWRELYDSSFVGGGQAWMSIDRDKISRAARRLLARDTARLNDLAQGSPAIR